MVHRSWLGRVGIMGITSVVACACAAPSPGERPVRYDDQVVVRVPVDGPADVAALAVVGDVWTEHVVDHVDVRVEARLVDALPGPHTVVIADVQAAVEARYRECWC